MKIINYTITNIHRGKGNRKDFIYAELYDEIGSLVISATLDYIIKKVEKMTRIDQEKPT